jgi:hypothetical protein
MCLTVSTNPPPGPPMLPPPYPRFLLMYTPTRSSKLSAPRSAWTNNKRSHMLESTVVGEPKHHASTAVIDSNWLAFMCLGIATVTVLIQAIR